MNLSSRLLVGFSRNGDFKSQLQPVDFQSIVFELSGKIKKVQPQRSRTFNFIFDGGESRFGL